VPGTVAWEFANCSRVYPTSASCWGVDVATKSGCPQGAFVQVEILDSNGIVIDDGIDSIIPLPEGGVGSAHGDTFSSDAASFRVTKISCFSY
jgi:hypothetical protein